MSTTIRPELSKNNKYWISRHRFYELKHFCLQYPSWKESLSECISIQEMHFDDSCVSKTNTVYKPVEEYSEMRSNYFDKVSMVEKAARDTDEELAPYILKAVTEGYSYTYLKSKMNIPCCKETYYELYRRFFWLLNNARN